MKKFIYLLILLPFFLMEANDKGIIEWKAVDGANGYRIEVRDTNKKLLVAENTKTNKYYIKTPMGSYEFRVSPLNVFEKPTVWSYWKAIRVIVSKSPEVTPPKTFSLSISEAKKPILLKGKNFLETMKVRILSKNSEIKVVESKLIDSNTYKIKLNEKDLNVGTYDISLENPNDKKTVLKNALTLKEDAKTADKKDDPKSIDKKDSSNSKNIDNTKPNNEQQEKERLAREQAEKEKLAREKAEKERLARDQAEKERLEKERLAREQAERERLMKEQAERDRLAKEQAERERIERERLEKERLAREQAERERMAREQAERERIERERIAREQADKERIERERIEKENALRAKLALLDTDAIYSMSSVELDEVIKFTGKTCGITELPAFLVDKCFNKHVEVNMRNKNKDLLFNYLKLKSDNYGSRIYAYKYFAKNCKPFFKAGSETMQKRLESKDLDSDERSILKTSIENQKTCS
ncbi:MAG: hypothetical protein SFU98_17700 [Leptospiraceae bacterium]|nr:hypothetical protein [Leptospiraceae bacterium]